MASKGSAQPRKPSQGARNRAARLAAVQALYQHLVTGTAHEMVLREFMNHRLGEESEEGEAMIVPDTQLLADVLRGAALHRGELVPKIESCLSRDWTMSRLEVLLQATLLAGCWELEGNRGIAAPIIINDYVEVARSFFADREPGLVNAVLDKLARRLRPDEFRAA